jgi:hypothetical protein
MEAWLTDNWYLITGPIGAVAIIAYQMHRRGGDEPFSRRLTYTLFPVLDSNSPERRSLTPRALVLFAVGVILLGILAFTGMLEH